MDVLDLGCGWGSLTLWLAGALPARANRSRCRTHGRSASIDRGARRPPNVEVVTADVNGLELDRALRPHRSRSRCSSTCATTRRCSARIASWLEPGGRSSSTSSRTAASRTRTTAAGWRGRSSPPGRCPRDDLLLALPAATCALVRALARRRQHYARTAEAWLERLDAHEAGDPAVLADAYGPGARGHGWQLAGLLPGLRRALGLPRRPRVARLALPVRAALMRIVRSAEIAAPPEKVFRTVTDLSTHPRWRPSVREFRTADGSPPAVGSEIVEVVRFAGRDVHMRYRITTLDPPRVLAAAYVAGPIDVAIRFDCEPAPAGTRTTFTCDTERPKFARVVPFPSSAGSWAGTWTTSSAT